MDGILRFNGAVKRSAEVDAWLESREAVLGGIAKKWFGVMRGCGADVRELMHDGLATVCIVDAPFAYVGVFKAHVNVGFFHGADLKDPAGLLQGTGKRMRHVKLRPGEGVDEEAVRALVLGAYARGREICSL